MCLMLKCTDKNYSWCCIKQTTYTFHKNKNCGNCSSAHVMYFRNILHKKVIYCISILLKPLFVKSIFCIFPKTRENLLQYCLRVSYVSKNCFNTIWKISILHAIFCRFHAIESEIELPQHFWKNGIAAPPTELYVPKSHDCFF